MPDIWGRTLTLGGVIPSTTFRLTWGTSPGLIALGARYTDARPAQIIMDPADGKLYFWEQLPRPTEVMVQGVLGDATEFNSFITTFAGSACGTGDLSFSVQEAKCENRKTVTFTVKNCRMVQIQGEAQLREVYMFAHTMALYGLGTEITVTP